MADEPLVSLEDDSASTAAVAPGALPAAVPAAIVATSEPSPAPDADPPSVDVGGEPYVPLSAVRAERSKRQHFAARAAEADRLEAENAAMRPYAEFLRANPQLLQPPSSAPAPAATPASAPTIDPEVAAVAQSLSLYKTDGTLDVEAAGKILEVADARADRRARATVAPLLQQQTLSQSELNFRTVLANLKDADGRPPSEQNLRAVWNAVGPQTAADPQVAALLGLMAIGADRSLAPRVVAPPASVPAVSEPSGGTPQSRATLSDLESRVAAQRQVAPTKWADLTQGHRAGRPSVLEE